jgi:hypothetical protein
MRADVSRALKALSEMPSFGRGRRMPVPVGDALQRFDLRFGQFGWRFGRDVQPR